VWNDVSETYNDVWVSYYEPTPMDAWSQPRRLTFDDSAERFFAGAFDANDDLFGIYDKTQTVYEDRQEWVNGQWVVVEEVPSAGQSDLYYLSYHMDGDLAVRVEDVEVEPANPLPGTPATVTASVQNIGEASAVGVEVAFYEGDPDAGGTLIDTTLITETLVGGDEAQVSVEWSVPGTLGPLTLYVRVDPSLTQEDRDRTNNTAALAVLAPDVTIPNVGAQVAGRHRIFTVRVANAGSPRTRPTSPRSAAS